MLKYLIHMIWPSSCQICGAVGADLCPSCCSQIVDPSGPLCLMCEGPVPCQNHGDLRWHSASTHCGVSRELVLSLKYQGNARIGLEMGRQMASVVPRPKNAVIVPVPLHVGSPRKYNQARWIAQGISDAWGFPLMDRLSWTVSLSCQTSLDGSERTDMPQNALVWKGPCLDGAEAVIVDDVKTTGTTLYRAYQALKDASPEGALFLSWSRASVVNS